MLSNFHPGHPVKPSNAAKLDKDPSPSSHEHRVKLEGPKPLEKQRGRGGRVADAMKMTSTMELC
ncbi:hypothetical protein DPMN_188489 [Dreissena polymorpha]|uniref:Uncharacterized protein n=1 Tax=Dreissena polymorpha TaxID=45954 RepID=A0A9D4DQW1_DREPO|nr:hypothetical protein DPMN_188489 [Dreissena polymorpha]